MNIRNVPDLETDTTLTLEWDPVPGQQGYVATIDSSEILADGKRHFSGSKTRQRVKISKVLDDAPHAYGVNILGIKEQGSVVIPAPAPPPPPPPPPTGLGAKLRAAFPALPAPKKLVENKTLGGNVADDGQDVIYRGCTNTFTKYAFHAFGSAQRVQYVRNRIIGPTQGGEDDSSDYHGIKAGPWDGSTPVDVRIEGGEIGPYGTSKFSHGLYFEAVKRALVQSAYVHGIGDFVFQFYPGDDGVASDATVVNSTFGWPRLSSPGVALVVWADQGSWECDVYNSIIWGNLWVEGDAELRLHNCVWPSQFRAVKGQVELDNVSRVDPKLDAQLRPTAPEAFTTADPGWVPSHDYKGTPYTRSVVGAVAA